MNRARSLVTIVCAALAAAVCLAPRTARACGGFYAQDISVSPDQEIVVALDHGIETYVFRPRFCGAARDFGVILPIPSALAASPTLADAALFDALDAFTAPEIVKVCRDDAGGCATKNDSGAADPGLSRRDPDTGVNVVERGRVGQFDFALLQATNVSAFTDWLDANGFPHGSGNDALYQTYVKHAWYFVAFKVSTDPVSVPAGKKLCGDLGPITLQFAASTPVIPARIAGVNGAEQRWRIYVIADRQVILDPSIERPNPYADGPGFFPTLYFSGTLGANSVPLAAAANRRLTAYTIQFPYRNEPGSDIEFLPIENATDYRTRIEVQEDCAGVGCASGSGLVTDFFAIALMFGFLGALRRAARRA